MKRTDFDLDEMQRLWQKQSRALEGHSLISEDEMMRAMQSTRKAEVRPLHLWRRVAAVAAVLIVVAVAVWQWPAQPATSQLAEATPSPQNNQKTKSNQNIPIIQNTPKTLPLIAEVPAQKDAEKLVASQIEELPQFIAPVAVEEDAADEGTEDYLYKVGLLRQLELHHRRVDGGDNDVADESADRRADDIESGQADELPAQNQLDDPARDEAQG